MELEDTTYQKNVVGEKCLWHFARESTLDSLYSEYASKTWRGGRGT